MAIKRTKKELAERLRREDIGALRLADHMGVYERLADVSAAFLGVELAPDKPELADWFGREELEARMSGRLVEVRSSSGAILGSFLDPATGLSWVEANNRFVRMKRKLEAYAENYRYVGMEKGGVPAVCLRIARGEDA